MLAVVLIFALTLAPSIQPKPTDLPIAFVNEDEGVTLPNGQTMNMGEKLAQMIQQEQENELPIKWATVKNEESVRKGLDNQSYYAALVIPKDFSEKQASLQISNPMPASVHIIVNQGMNTMASTMAGQVLNSVVDKMDETIQAQLLQGFEQQGRIITTTQAKVLASPITKVVTNVNETGTNTMNGNAPVALFQPIWMASIAGSVLLFFSIKKLSWTTRRDALIARLAQTFMGAVLALFAGFGLTSIIDLLGVNIPSFVDTALFLSVASFSFFLMISAVLSWMGIRGIPLFVLILFFGAPLLSMAPEFMSPFYKDWVYSWLPMRFMVEGLRELFFFHQAVNWNGSMVMLVSIAAGSFIILVSSVLKPGTTVQQSAKTSA